ncbi:MAG: glycosyltransferase [Oscillospiraceae bacterium]|nr:glycosyltransferase [Oscillospiraceae bacterium]
MQKILFVITSLSGGGAERIISNLTTGFPPEWEIDILIARKDSTMYPHRGNLFSIDIKDGSNRNNLLYRIRVLLKKYIMLRNLKKKGGYTACVSFMTRSNILNVLTGNKRCKTIVSVRCDGRHNKYKRSKDKVESYLNGKADFVISISNGVREHLINNVGLPPKKVKTIYNGFDVNNYIHGKPLQSEIAKLISVQDSFTFITAGRLTSQKNQWHLIRVFAHLSKRHPKCSLIILGEGELRPYLEELVSDFGVEANVHFAGFVENTFDYYREASAFVFTSLWEGFGNVLIEAMMCGLPVISTDCHSGPREILAPTTDVSFQNKGCIEYADYGILVPPCSGVRHGADAPLELQEQLLLDAMEKIINDDDMRESYVEQSRKRAGDFAIEKIVGIWTEVIEGI